MLRTLRISSCDMFARELTSKSAGSFTVIPCVPEVKGDASGSEGDVEKERQMEENAARFRASLETVSTRVTQCESRDSIEESEGERKIYNRTMLDTV
jgi:hypothetical protein